MGMQQAATGTPSLEDQIRAQWGQYGDWKAADQDQVTALANLMRQNGIEDLSKFQLKAREYDIPGYKMEQGGDAQQTVDVEGRKVTAFDAYYDGKMLDFLGNVNDDGSVAKYERQSQDKADPNGFGNLHGSGDLLGWSSSGHGNTSFKVMAGPDGSPVVVPTWGSSSQQTYGDARGIAMVLASALGAQYVPGDGGMSGLDMAAIDAGAGATNVGTQLATTTGMTAAEQASMMAANGMTDVEIANVLGGQIGSDLTGTSMNAIANGSTIADGTNSFRPSQNYGEGLTGNQTTVYDKTMDLTGSGTLANTLASNGTVADGIVNVADGISTLSDVNSVKNASDAANSGNKGGSNSMNWLDVINTAVGIYGVAKAGENSSDATDAMQNVANGQMALNQEALDWYKQVYADGADDRAAATQRANAISDSLLTGMNFANTQAQELDQYNKTTFRPIEQRMAATATDYNTAERRETAANDATGQVAASYDIQRQQAQRDMERAGVDPSTIYALGVSSRLDEAKAQAGAANTARTGVEQQGWSRMADVANMGRGIASQQATQQGIATTTGNSSTSNAMQGLNASQSGNNLMSQGYQNATQGNQVTGNLFNQVAAGQRADDQMLINGVGGITNYMGNRYGTSDPKVKKGTGKMANAAQALKEVEATPVHDGWEYDESKGAPPGSGGQKMTGPMATDVQRVSGEASAPGGKQIDLVKQQGRMMAAIQKLAKDVRSLKKHEAQPEKEAA